MKIRLAVLGVAVLAMWGLKCHYADARADDLRWILSPTARVVDVVTGAGFAFEPGQGYLSRERLFLIEKSCAGINFMIAAFGMLVFSLRRRIGSAASAAGVLAAGVMASYSAAVVVNAARISAALWLRANPVAVSGISAAQIHRVEGIVVYFGGLVLLYELVLRFDRRAAAARSGR